MDWPWTRSSVRPKMTNFTLVPPCPNPASSSVFLPAAPPKTHMHTARDLTRARERPARKVQVTSSTAARHYASEAVILTLTAKGRMGVALMLGYDWLSIPIGIDAERWVTRAGCRTVLAVAHTVTSAQRLIDVVDYVESDPRVQVVFTVAPDAFNHPVSAYLHRLGALVLPWEQAVRERFDLALAAAHGGLRELHAPLVLMAHGAGHGKLSRPGLYGGALLAHRSVYGLDAERLTGDGRVLASALLLAHDDERDVLRRQCPEALAAAVVTGDPCYDRLVASLPGRDRYRRALGVRAGQELVVVSSTWGRDGLFGNVPDLLPRLMDQLSPARFRVGALLHPAVWGAHGARQVRAWTRDCREAGLILLDPAEDWRAMLVAADHVLGDHGSVTVYAAALGR